MVDRGDDVRRPDADRLPERRRFCRCRRGRSPGLDSAAGEHQAVAEVPVVAAGGGVDLRRAAEFAHHDDQRPVEQAAVDQIVEQARHRRVELRQQFALQPC